MRKQILSDAKSLHKMEKSSGPERSHSSDGLGNQSLLAQRNGTHTDAQSVQAKLSDGPDNSAFDSQSGHTLTPLSSGGPSFSASAPIQAKKAEPTNTANPLAQLSPSEAAKNMIDFNTVYTGLEDASNWNHQNSDQTLAPDEVSDLWGTEKRKAYMDKYALASGFLDFSHIKDARDEVGMDEGRGKDIRDSVDKQRGKIMQKAAHRFHRNKKFFGEEKAIRKFTNSREMMQLNGIHRLKQAQLDRFNDPNQFFGPGYYVFDEDDFLKSNQYTDERNMSSRSLKAYNRRMKDWNAIQALWLENMGQLPASKKEMLKRVKRSSKWDRTP